MSSPAGPINLPSRDPGKPYPRTLGAPDRPVAVPNPDWRAREGETGGDNGSKSNRHWRILTRSRAKPRPNGEPPAPRTAACATALGQERFNTVGESEQRSLYQSLTSDGSNGQ
jgi:hypothetical protein